MSKRTALQVVSDIVKQLNARAINVVEYEVNGYEEDKPQLIVMDPSQLEDWCTESSPANKCEFGIASEYTDEFGDIRHMVFADMDNTKMRPKMPQDIKLRSSETGTHIYRAAHRESVTAVTAHLLRQMGPFLDLKWLAVGLDRGFHVLRLTANTDRFKSFGVPTEI